MGNSIMTQTPAQRKAALKYRKEKTRSFTMTLYPKDADIIAWLESQERKSEAVKSAIRSQIRSSQE